MEESYPVVIKGNSIFLALACAGLTLGACTPKEDTMGSGSGTPAEDDGNPTDTGNVSDTDTPGDTGPGDTGPMDESGDTGPAATTGVGFIEDPDGGGVSFECDIFAQDCAEGEKCMPWANDGGTWNATRCSPISDNPGQPGDECTVEGSGASGLDDCDIGAMCWDVDPETNIGQCEAMCTGDDSNPVCEDPDTTCSIANDGAIVLCLAICDPLIQDCPDGSACYPVAEDFVCGPDASGEMGTAGDPCEFINVCDPGLFCLNPGAWPGCTAGGCCSPVCDLDDPAGDAQCPGEGQTCQPWYEEGAAPPGYESVGACALPG